MQGAARQRSDHLVRPLRAWSRMLAGLLLGSSLLLAAPLSAQAAYDELPAFPGAEGFGYAAAGGRGGEVYHVTSHDLTGPRSEEHTSELKSRGHLVCRLLLAKKKPRSA